MMLQGIVEKALTAPRQIAAEQCEHLPAQLSTKRGFRQACEEFWKSRISERLRKSSQDRF